MQQTHHCHHCSTTSALQASAKPWRVDRKLIITGGIFLGLLLLSFLPALRPLNESLIAYIKMIWWAVLLGFFMGGAIDYFIPDQFIYKYIGRRQGRSLLHAVLAGFLMSACSHGILAIAMQLYKKGAYIPAVITFLLASPWANVPVTILLFGFFGWKAFLFIAAAMLIALITGSIFMTLDHFGAIETSRVIEHDGRIDWSHLKDFDFREARRGILHGALDLANMILWWLLIGFLISALIGAYVPDFIFVEYLGPNLTGLLLTLAFATVIEVCSEGSAPIAFEIFTKVGAIGNPFVFLMAGVVTDFTEIGLVYTTIGKRTALWLPVVTVPLVVAFGLLFNTFF